MNERTFPTSDAHKLEDPERLTWLPPKEIIASLELRPGMTVADVGAGTGYWALPIAEAIGSDGKVYAVDFQTGMLDLLGKKLLEPNAPANVSPVHGSATHTTLPASCADLVFMGSIWHELDDHALVLKEVARLLRQNGRLAILDWRTNVAFPPGPPLEHRIPSGKVVENLGMNGWTVERSGNVGKYSYLVIAGHLSHGMSK